MMKQRKKMFALLTVLCLLCALCGAAAEENVFYGQNDHGVGGTIRVAVTMDGDTIKAIKTVEQKETRGLGTTAILQLTKDIVAANSLDVDAVSGATLSSIAFTGAVRQAVEEATGFDPTADVTLGENEYLGVSDNGLGGRLMVKVTVEDGKIAGIDVLEAHESEEIGIAALNAQIPKLVENNGEAADAISGATITCDALNEAVAQAMAASQQ
ncbi:MAG: FMN-binding protein [Clostridia bacterium]|nr:FMN-binding protein [Clostridia bacterium]